jgi:hypothetical protein
MNNNNSVPVKEEHQNIWTYADTAQVMANLMPNFDWDTWKDEMKESDL